MGFDITAYDNKGNEIADLHAYMGAFRMLSEQGYDWFTLIDAIDCNCGVSGCGRSSPISLVNLKNAMQKLDTHDTKGKLACNSANDYRDEFTYRKPMLKEFMQKCIDWCEKNNRKSIRIFFG